MAITLPTSITLGSKSRISDPSIHPRVDELNNDNTTRYRRRHNDNNLRVSLKQMEWGQYNPYLNLVRWYSRFRFGIQHDNSWFRFLTRDYNKRAASQVLEVTEIERTIETTATTTSLSVFSQ